MATPMAQQQQMQQKKRIQSIRNWYSLNDYEAQQSWSKLERAFNEIYRKNYSNLSFEELHRYATKLTLAKQGEMIYTGVAQSIKSHLCEFAKEQLQTLPNEQLLQAIASLYNDHKIASGKIRDVLLFVDRNYVSQQKKKPIFAFALEIFKNEIIFHENIRGRLQCVLLENVEKERNGLLIDRAIMKAILEMLEDLSTNNSHSQSTSSATNTASNSTHTNSHGSIGNDDNIYVTEFEYLFLEQTRSYYRRESIAFLAENSVTEFVKKAETRISEEALRCRNYLAKQTANKLKTVMDNEYIAAHAQALVNMEHSGLASMLERDLLDELKRLYNLLFRVIGTVDLLRECFGKYIKGRCEEIIAEDDKTAPAPVASSSSSGAASTAASKDPIQFVEKMLQLRAKCDQIVEKCFFRDNKCQKQMKDAFEDAINKDTRAAGHLASYVDELLKGTMKQVTSASEKELEDTLDNCLILFRYLRDKDIFENYARNLLMKRLLNNRNICEDSEKCLLTKLKGECGQQYTSKMEGMFLDITILSKELMESYKQTANYKSSSIELDVQTLTQSHWSIKPVPNCNLPSGIANCCINFVGFYIDRFKTGRRLQWLLHMGSADMKANFSTGRKDLNVSTFQMCILMLFNNRTTYSFNEIKEATGIVEPEIRRHLLSLCTPKLRILKKSSKGKNIEDDDVISFNNDFESKFKRIRVPLISSKEFSKVSGTPDEGGNDGAVPAAVEEDRRHLAEATIVRILKARRRISHVELLAEATRQLSSRFPPTSTFMKQRIESLIEREYMERDKDDLKYYIYLA